MSKVQEKRSMSKTNFFMMKYECAPGSAIVFSVFFPCSCNKALCKVFITPNMHKFHHHFERPWTDTNFGNIFSFWDKIFGTWVYDDPKKVVYGLDVLEDDKALDIKYQLKVPFNKDIMTDY